MTVYQSRTHRAPNTALIERQERAAERVPKHAARMGLALGCLVAVRFYYGSQDIVIVAAALFVAFWGWGLIGLYVDLHMWLQEVDEDEIEYRTMAHDAAPGDARLMVRTTPQQVTLPVVPLKNYERLAIGYTFEREGWKWRRDPIFRKAGITNYAARYKAITEAVQDAGMLDGLGMVRQEYRGWWTSPTPQVIDNYAIDGADDDAVDGG